MRSQLGLVVVPPALPAGTSRLTYVRGAVGNPVCLAVAVFAGCIGLGTAGLFGAAIAVLMVLVLGANAARYRMVRSYVDGQARARAMAKRECRRLRLLQSTGPSRQQHYEQLRVLVEEIERLDPAEAARFELQDLLDHFVHLAVSHQRCVEALRLADATALPPAMPLEETPRSKHRREILQHRIRNRNECERRMAQISDELEGIGELVRLVAQRTARPALDVDLDRELERRLWELEEVDAAMDQLSA
jgi:hypothetical protein